MLSCHDASCPKKLMTRQRLESLSVKSSRNVGAFSAESADITRMRTNAGQRCSSFLLFIVLLFLHGKGGGKSLNFEHSLFNACHISRCYFANFFDCGIMFNGEKLCQVESTRGLEVFIRVLDRNFDRVSFQNNRILAWLEIWRC